jgi:uncharacterized membrane protein
MPPTRSAAARVPSLDIIRGAVMVLMALDHVRVFSGVAAGGRTPAIFFTRWVTHFCAPAFIFLAGTAIFLYGQKLGGRGERGRLARFLLVRGAWLILMEMTLIRFGWTFNFDYAHYALAGVIWVIGWCMILMAGLVFLPVATVGVLGAAILAGHDLMDGRFWQLADTLNDHGLTWLWKILYFGFASGPIDVLGARLTVLYSLIPWIGVMAAGYAFGPIMRMDAARRRRWCLGLGGGAIALFLVLRAFDLYGQSLEPAVEPERRLGAGRSGKTAGAPAPAFPQHEQISRVASLSAHDARSDDRGHPPARDGARSPGESPDGLRAGSLLLLHPAHPAHSPGGGRSLAPARGARERVALRESPDGQPAGSRRLRVGPPAPVPGHARRRGAPVHPLPLDGRAQAATQRSLAALPVKVGSRKHLSSRI